MTGRHEKPEPVDATRMIAEVLHSNQCHYQHEDQCGWFYEKDGVTPSPTWEGSAHKMWYQKATQVMARLDDIDPAVIVRVIRAVSG